MKRFSRKKFSQIMLHNNLKLKLDQLKIEIHKEISVPWKLSYADVISYLVNQYVNLQKAKFQLDEKLLVSSSFKKSNLNVVVPLRKVSQRTISNLEAKKLVSFSLES